ncbi:T9SS type A sorting domain-containing protein [Lacinutrix sp. Bg11-31]|uniref:T9SS type A sorting domain-containing protein n=1 Tax=Lacinutrix sp. Bg11-31 TaxID=2057808 RepID=UPI000C30ADCF|nr:T9SS type A sorting domain-containing protein [Lacinutrix sp. Bg11-31]AUC81284.1 hypothetical protein CW733_03695 [Lacinutrix sp. Bg11-31]
MKQIYVLTSLLMLFTMSLIAQTTVVTTGVADPYRLELAGNNLYISEFNNGVISVLNINASLPTTKSSVISGLDQPMGIAIKDDFIYIAESGANKISKFDTTSPSPVLIDVVTGLNVPSGLVFVGNDLYFAELAGNKISKVDVTVASPAVTLIKTGLSSPFDIENSGTDLFIAESSVNKVSKIDISTAAYTKTDVVTGLSYPVALALNGTDLHIAEYFANKVSKIDVTNPTPIATDVVSSLATPIGLVSNMGSLFIAEFDANKISRFDFPTLSTSNFNLQPDFKVYPNPSRGFISVSGLKTTTNYTIYNSLGAEIMKGNISENQKIDIQNLSNDLYFLNLNNGNTFKFLRQ